MLQARGSLEELLDDLNVCIDENYFPIEQIENSKARGMARSQTHQWLHSILTQSDCRKVFSVQESPSDYGLSDEELDDLFFGRFNPSSLQRFNQ